MEVESIIIAMRQKNLIEQICDLAFDCATNYKTLDIRGKILKLTHILFMISLVGEEDIKLLNKEEAKRYKYAIEWVWDEINNVADRIVNNNIKYCNYKLNEEEDLSKLSKEELIARLKEATK